MNIDQKLLSEAYHKIVLEQSAYTPPTPSAAKPGESLQDASIRMANNMFAGAYNQYQQRQQQKASGNAYKTSSSLWLHPIMENGVLVPKEDLKTFKAVCKNGTIKRIDAYMGQTNPTIPPRLTIDVDYMSNVVPEVVIDSPKYRVLETALVDKEDTKIEKNIKVAKK